MNHSVNFAVEYEILGKNKKKKTVVSKLVANDVLVEKFQGDMKLEKHAVPFKSFVKNFGATLAYILGGTKTNTVVNAGGTTQDASTILSVSEAAITATHSRRGIYIGDKAANTVVAASYSAVSASTSKSFLTGAVGNSVQKSDVFLKRRIEASSASVATKVSYGAVSITIPSENTVKITRRFYNTRGTSIKINEVGLGTQNVITGAAYFVDHNILLARDTMAYDVTLADQQYLDITYSFSLPEGGYLTNNLIVMLANLFKNSPTGYSYKTVSGTTPINPPPLTGLTVMGIADNTDYGIQVGGTYTSHSSYDYKLEADISNAVLDRSATTYLDLLTETNTSTKFGFQRDFTNVGTVPVTVKEGCLNVEDQDNKGILLARFPINGIELSANDILRIKVYFEFPVVTTNYVTQEA